MTDQTTFYSRALIITLITATLVQATLFFELKHLPSPVYGGDLYRERGFVQYILNGQPYRTDPYFKNELEFYPPLGYLTAALLVKLTPFNLDTVLNFFPVLITFFSTLAWYSLGHVLFTKKSSAFFLALAGLATNFFPLKHTYGMAFIFSLLFLKEFICIQKNKQWKTALRGGIFLGLTGLTHYQPFLYLWGMTGIALFIELVRAWLKKNETYQTTTKKDLLKYGTLFSTGLLISMIFLSPLIYRYEMKTPNRTQEYSLFDVNKHGISWILTSTKNIFVQTSSIPSFLFSILACLGVLACVLNLHRYEQRISILLLAGSLLITAHYLITKPLFNAWIVPSHLFTSILIPFTIMTAWGARFIEATIEKKIPNKARFVIPALTLFIILPVINNAVDTYNHDRWTQYGRQFDIGTQTLYDLGHWILTRTTQNDVFLAHDESAFALNALTGRHVVTVRRTHASPYVDVDQRYADALVMLYGRHQKTRDELLKNYSVNYVYVDQFLLTQPMITSINHENYLKENGVDYTRQTVRLDPSTADAPQYLSLVITPQELKIINQSTLVQQFLAGDKPFAIIYRINTP